MPFRMFSEYECWCSGSERTIFGKHSVYSRSILAVRFRADAYGTAFGSSKNVLHMFKIIFMACRCIREVFGKHSRNIRHVRKTVGKHTSSYWWIRNEVLGSVCFPNTRMDLEHDECFPNMNVGVLGANGPYSGSIRSIRKPFGVFGNHSKPYWKHSESKRKAFGDTLRKCGVVNTFGGVFGQFWKSHHYRIRKKHGMAFGPVWTGHKPTRSYGITWITVHMVTHKYAYYIYERTGLKYIWIHAHNNRLLWWVTDHCIWCILSCLYNQK
jgi:hypothetical protein